MKNKVSVLRNLEYIIGGMSAYIAAISDEPIYDITRNLLDDWRETLYDVRDDIEDEDAENT